MRIVLEDKVTLMQVSELMNVSIGQAKRLKSRPREMEAKGLVNAHRLPEDV